MNFIFYLCLDTHLPTLSHFIKQKASQEDILSIDSAFTIYRITHLHYKTKKYHKSHYVLNGQKQEANFEHLRAQLPAQSPLHAQNAYAFLVFGRIINLITLPPKIIFLRDRNNWVPKNCIYQCN